MIGEEAALYIPAPGLVVLFEVKVQFEMVGLEAPALHIPPPLLALFKAKAQFEMVGEEPEIYIPPPLFAPLAVFDLKKQFEIMIGLLVELQYIPPPPEAAIFESMVQ